MDYHFLSQADFDRRVAAGEFLEHAVYAGNSYGTLWSELERPARGIVLEIDVQGARQVRERAARTQSGSSSSRRRSRRSRSG